ncbi:MAG: flavin reductase family protein [Myxococcota bacterium]|nr:flavin reductase family protein [Myxococcota bacterium]
MRKRIGPKPLIFPMPAVLVGTYSEDGTPNAMTAAWASVCCHRPVCVGVAIRKSRLTFANLQQNQAFTLAVPNTSLAAKVDFLGIVSGAKEPKKLSVADIETVKGDTVNAPILIDCPVNLECTLVEQVALGTHTFCIGEVLETQVDEAVLTDMGSVDASRLDPLIYVTSESKYRALGEVVGQAFEDGKQYISV